MYFEIRKPPIIIVVPKISDATKALGIFGFGLEFTLLTTLDMLGVIGFGLWLSSSVV